MSGWRPSRVRFQRRLGGGLLLIALVTITGESEILSPARVSESLKRLVPIVRITDPAAIQFIMRQAYVAPATEETVTDLLLYDIGANGFGNNDLVELLPMHQLSLIVSPGDSLVAELARLSVHTRYWTGDESTLDASLASRDPAASLAATIRRAIGIMYPKGQPIKLMCELGAEGVMHVEVWDLQDSLRFVPPLSPDTLLLKVPDVLQIRRTDQTIVARKRNFDILVVHRERSDTLLVPRPLEE